MDEDFAYVFIIIITVVLILILNIFYILYILTLPKYIPKKSRKGLQTLHVMDISVGPCGDLDMED